MPGVAIDVRRIIDALDEPTIIVEGSRVELANAAARKLLGGQIEGRDVRLAIRHPQALEFILARRPGEIDVTGIGELDRAWRLVIKKVDVSVVVRMVDRSAAVSAEKMRVDFVANASHELRTPLATIIGYAETLAEGDHLSDELRASFSRTIGDEAHRMLRIVEDLMNLSRVEADRFVKPTELISISEVIDAAVTNPRFTRNAAKCRVTTDVSNDLPKVPGDFDQLVQVFDNLLTNAVRYGSVDGHCTIEVSVTQETSFLAVVVADQGPGIAREHLPRLTERFYRVDAARSRESGGTGLGLAIVKHIVERHRGSLDIASELGKGTIVTVRLPTGR